MGERVVNVQVEINPFKRFVKLLKRFVWHILSVTFFQTKEFILTSLRGLRRRSIWNDEYVKNERKW